MQYRFTKDLGVIKAGDIYTILETVNISVKELVKVGLLEEVKEEEWPKMGDVMFAVDDCGFVRKARWMDSAVEHHRAFLGIYRTKEEAEKARDDVREFIRNRNKSND